jgi:hypothetical protein
MGTTDYGTQNITFQYQEAATSLDFNKLNNNILPTGIYNGGLLSKASSNIIQVAPVDFVIEDSNNKVSVKVTTLVNANIEVSAATPFIVFRWEYASSVNNYVDFLSVAYSDIQTDDLIVGRCIYESGTLQTNFDYSRKSYSYLGSLKSDENELRVYATEPYSNKVYVTSGEVYSEDGTVSVTAGNSPTVSDTTLGRIDLVYIDDDGSIGIIEGTDAASPVRPKTQGKHVIAEISRGASATYITGNDITRLNDLYKYFPKAQDISLKDSGSNYNSEDVEDAFAELASTSSGEGASIIGVHDAEDYFSGVNVEAVLAEIGLSSHAKVNTGVSVSSTRAWYTIAKIDSSSGVDTNGYAEFIVRTKYGRRMIKFGASFVNDSSVYPKLIPMQHHSSLGYQDQNAYIKGRIVFNNADDDESGALLQISLRWSTSVTDEEVVVRISDDTRLTTTSEAIGWEIVDITQDDSPNLPDGTLYADTEQKSEWLTSSTWVSIDDVNGAGIDHKTPFTGFNSLMYSEYWTNFYYSAGSLTISSAICHVTDWDTTYRHQATIEIGSDIYRIVVYGPDHATDPNTYSVASQNVSWDYFTSLWARNTGAIYNLD